jgi:hypothetical protein
VNNKKECEGKMNKGGMFLRWNFAGCVFGKFGDVFGHFWTLLEGKLVLNILIWVKFWWHAKISKPE